MQSYFIIKLVYVKQITNPRLVIIDLSVYKVRNSDPHRSFVCNDSLTLTKLDVLLF